MNLSTNSGAVIGSLCHRGLRSNIQNLDDCQGAGEVVFIPQGAIWGRNPRVIIRIPLQKGKGGGMGLPGPQNT
jgi:hypothetical protein